jgi:hypothetical protein
VSVSLHTGQSSHEVGSASSLQSFFSTVFLRLESATWGSRFPAIMRDLYAGTLPSESCDAALRELAVIRRELAELSPAQVVWNHEQPAARPPWGTNISPQTSLLQRVSHSLTSSSRCFRKESAEARRSEWNDHVSRGSMQANNALKLTSHGKSGGLQLNAGWSQLNDATSRR